MNMYQRGKIYAIRSYQTDEVYIGSTIQPLSERLRKHRVSYKLYLEGKFNNMTSFKMLEYEDHYIELIELYPCTTKEELNKREGEIIRATDNTVNRKIEGRTMIEYYEDNKEYILQRNKQYREQNREVIQQYSKLYYNDNKEAILQKNKQTITCECGTTYTLGHRSRHLRTAKHQAYEEANNLYINVLFEE